MKKILAVGPMPPPLTGQSIAFEALVKSLRAEYNVTIVNLSKSNLKSGGGGLSRVWEVLRIIGSVNSNLFRSDLIYLTVSESIFGNLKDLLLYFVCFSRLGSCVIHVHGGSLRTAVLDRNRILRIANYFFFRRLGGIVILGETHRAIFAGPKSIIAPVVVPNFAAESLFRTDDEIRAKFDHLLPLRIVYLSNFVLGKGFSELLDAYLSLDRRLHSSIRIDFAGGFESDAQMELFLKRIDGYANLYYHGILDEQGKAMLLSGAHVFCLPSRLKEGQPISILEAYASGCVVIATGSGGIPDVFKDRINGILVEAGSSLSIMNGILEVAQRTDLYAIGLRNAHEARSRFKLSTHTGRMHSIFHDVQLRAVPADCV